MNDKLIIRGGTVVNPDSEEHEVKDVLIENGRIGAVGGELAACGAVDELDAGGLYLFPGLVDMHAHLREPGYEYKEDVQTGLEAAVAGGFTTVACMPNTEPPVDCQSVVEYLYRRADEVDLARLAVIGCLTKGRKGREMAEIREMLLAGARGFSDDGSSVEDSMVMRRVLEYMKMFDAPVLDHCEDHALSADGLVHEGLVATQVGLEGVPAAAESSRVFRDVNLAAMLGVRLHVTHLSLAESLDIVKRARAAGAAVTCDVTPHHLVLTHEAVRGFDANAKVNPPLRPESDRQALIRGLADGSVDAIATDHAPHADYEKDVEFEYAANGLIGLETALGLALTVLVGEGHIGLGRLVALMSANPAAILGLEGGRIAPGAPADLTFVDLDHEWTVDPAGFKSRSRNTPFAGWKLRGRAVRTMVGGRTRFELI